MNQHIMAQQREREEIMEYILLCSSIDGPEEDARELMEILRSITAIETPLQLYYFGNNAIEILSNQGKIRGFRIFQLQHLVKWMEAYVTQDGKQRTPADLTKSLQEWRQVITGDTFEEFIQTGEIHTPPPSMPQPTKPIISKQPAPDPPGYHINDSKAHVPTLMDDPMPTTPARTIDPGEDKPNLPGIWKQHVPEEVPTPTPTTQAPTQSAKARSTQSPTTVMSHPTWEYWCHSSTPFRGAYPSYDDDYSNSISLPTMAAPTPTFTSDICIIGDPPYQLRGG